MQIMMSLGYDEYDRSLLISQTSFEKTFGMSSVFIESTLMENGGIAESANPSTLIRFQDALPRLEILVLYAFETRIQRISSN